MGTRAKATKPFVLGRTSFAAITAVEGLKLSRAGERRLETTRDKTPEQRRQETVNAFRTRKRA